MVKWEELQKGRILSRINFKIMSAKFSPSDDGFQQLSGSFFHHFWESLLNEKNERSQKLALFLAIVVLAYAGVEAVKLIFRNNFGAKGINVWKLFLSFGAFVAIGIIAFNNYQTNGELAEYGSKQSFLYTAIFYFALALFLLVKGVIEVRKRATNPVHFSYRGDSTVLGFLADSGWNQAKIQNLGEPLFVLAIGIFLTPINWFLGLPLVFCAISVWIHYGYEYVRGLLNARDTLSDSKGNPEYFEQSSRVVN